MNSPQKQNKTQQISYLGAEIFKCSNKDFKITISGELNALEQNMKKEFDILKGR